MSKWGKRGKVGTRYLSRASGVSGTKPPFKGGLSPRPASVPVKGLSSMIEYDNTGCPTLPACARCGAEHTGNSGVWSADARRNEQVCAQCLTPQERALPSVEVPGHG